MFRLILCLFIMAGSSALFAQTVDTFIETEGKGSYFYEEFHPTKFDFSTFTFCGGRNADSASATFKTEKETRRGNSGNWDVNMNTEAHKGLLSSMISQQLQWDSKFDEKEYTFNVRLKKKVGAGQVITHRNTCNTRTWHYRVDAAQSRFISSVRVVIPENVYVARFRTSFPGTKNVRATINKVRAIGVDDEHEPAALQGIQAGEGTLYFFVKPHEEISIEVVHDDAGTNVDLVADFEVTFMGYNRCEKGIREFRQLSGQDANGVITKEIVTTAFSTIKDGILQKKPSSSEDVHKAILFLGCLTSESVAKALIYDNTAKQVEEILSGIDDFSAQVTREKSNSETVDNTAKPLRVLEAMARNAVASSVIRGLKPLCERYPSVGDDDKIKGLIPGYFVFRYKLDLIASTLGISPDVSRQGAITDYFHGLLEALEKMSGASYADLLKERKSEILDLVRDYESNGKVAVVEEAAKQFNLLPPIEPNHDLVAMDVQLMEMKAKIYRVNEEFLRLTDLFAANSQAPLDLTRFKKHVDDFAASENEFRGHFGAVYEVFSQEYAQSFRDVIQNLDDRHIQTTREWMEHKYGGFLKQFSDFQKDKMGGEKTAKELEKCIYQPITPNN